MLDAQWIQTTVWHTANTYLSNWQVRSFHKELCYVSCDQSKPASACFDEADNVAIIFCCQVVEVYLKTHIIFICWFWILESIMISDKLSQEAMLYTK